MSTTALGPRQRHGRVVVHPATHTLDLLEQFRCTHETRLGINLICNGGHFHLDSSCRRVDHSKAVIVKQPTIRRLGDAAVMP